MQKLPKLTLLLLLTTGLLWLVRHDRLQPVLAADEAATKGDGAQPETPRETPESAAAIALLRGARQRLFGYSSVRASIREYVQLGEYRFEAEGSYIAGPFNPLPQLRLEYQVRVGNTVGTLLEVCDGQILRTQKTIQRLERQPANAVGSASPDKGTEPETTVTRRDVSAILKAVHKHGPTPETILQAELGIGGLPALLTSIERCMAFDSVREEPLAGRPCHVLQATWKPEYLAQLTQQFRIFGRNVQTYLPAFVRIHLDAETLFPLRITYWPAPAESGPALPALLTLEFTDVRLNEQVSPLLFEFPATGADETDVTEQFVDAIKAASAAGAAAAVSPPSGEASP